MKKIIGLVILLWIINSSTAQNHNTDSLRSVLATATNDTTTVNVLGKLSWSYYYKNNFDSALLLVYRGLELAQSIGYKKGEIDCMQTLVSMSWNLGDFATSIKFTYPIIEYARDNTDTSLLVFGHAILSNSYRDQGDFKEALQISKNRMPIILAWDNCSHCGVAYAAIGSHYFGLEQYDSALFYIEKGLTYPKDFAYGWELMMAGRTHARMGNDELAFKYLLQSIQPLIDRPNPGPNLKDLTSAYANLSGLYNKTGNHDSAIYFGKQSVSIGKTNQFNKELLEGYSALAQAYETVDETEALNYLKLAIELKNDIYSQDKQKQITSLKFNEILKQNEIKAAQLNAENKLKLNALLGSTFTLMVIAFLLFRNNQNKLKAKQKIEVAYDQLKSTQSQLIQSEKMASLGELTAGIAHEIQNPLNFVNNFSEVNKELLTEMEGEIDKGNFGEAKTIVKDVIANEEKINHHGKRADAIVKGMLQHSRASSGQKELTDINALCDEYLRLSYHGFRAKDKSFNATLKTDFDASLPKINVVPQDVGRVILNLINNAFYAVSEKQKQNIPDYEPTVWVSTRRVGSPSGAGGSGGKIEISVKDNGNGIPESIKEKIFQPFFTTKPTGQGTGLGLSLSYDIVKAHGGEVTVETSEGEGSEFIIQLPLNLN